jgi:hypothetical protein
MTHTGQTWTVTMEETKKLRILERKAVREIQNNKNA